MLSQHNADLVGAEVKLSTQLQALPASQVHMGWAIYKF